MPRRRLEDTFAALKRVREDPTSEASARELRRALSDRSSHAVAKAARIAGELEIGAVRPELLAAFERFMKRPADDPGCTAKANVAEALYRLGHDDPAVFLRGIRHVQMEPVFGGRVDTAVDLRGACALGLVRLGYRDALLELAQLLADAEPPVRISAARAIAYRGGDDGAPLLRLKALAGDREPRVTSECLGALLRISPGKSLPFVAGFLDGKDRQVAEAAALALGESRLPEAFDALRSWSERVRDGDLQRVAYLATAMLRRDEAFEFLLAVVREGEASQACGAIAALGIHRDDERLRARLAEAAGRHEDARVGKALADALR